MNKWNYDRLSNLCSKIGDGLHGTPEYSNDSDIFFINGNNLKNGKIEITESTKKISTHELKNNYIPLNKNTLLLSINGTLGSMAFYNNEKVMLGKSAAYLNFKSEINRFYYYYFQLASVQQYFYNVATGSTIKNLSLKSIQDFEVPVPDPVEWKNISEVLSSIDSKIELNNRINAALEAMAKTLYDYWFVQFDFPDAKGKPYKTSGGKMVWNEELKREIPEEWGVGRLERYSEVIRGVTYNKNEIKSKSDKDVIPILRATNITDNQIDLNDMVYLHKSNLSNNQILKKFDILMTMSSGSKLHVGKNAFYCYNQELSYGAFCSKISINTGMKYYVYQILQSVEFKKYISNVCLGTNINNLTNEHINGYNLLVPSEKQLMIFEKIIKTNYDQISCHIIQNQKLSELRDWLLPMLMNGQVRVG